MEKKADNIRLNIEIGMLKSIEACITLNTPIAQWVLPRINPPKIFIL
ncbi:MAG: hypothetical protein ACRC03_14875 [Romboutsia sp.]